MIKKIIVLVTLVLWCNAGYAATLSICLSGCDGTDIQTVYNAASCGDTISINDNRTYLGGFSFNKSCEASTPLTVMKGAGNTPIVYTTGAEWEDGITVTGNYHILDGLTVDGVTHGNGIAIRGDHNTVQNCAITNIYTEDLAGGEAGEGLIIDGGEYNVITNNTFGDCAHSAVAIYYIGSPATYGRYNQILNNTIHNRYGHGISLIYNQTQYNLIDGNKISDCGSLSTNNGKSGIQISGGQNNTIRRNVIFDIYNRGMEISSYSAITNNTIGNLIYNNTFYNIPTRTTGTGNTSWVEMATGGSGGPYTITGNKFYNNIADKVGMQEISDYLTSFRGVWVYGHFAESDPGDTEEAVITQDWNDNYLVNNIIRPYFSDAYQLSYENSIYYMYCCYGDLHYTVTGINEKGSMAGNATSDCSFASTNTSVSNWWYIQSSSACNNGGIAVVDPNASTGGWAQLTWTGNPPIGAYQAATNLPTVTGCTLSGASMQ